MFGMYGHRHRGDGAGWKRRFGPFEMEFSAHDGRRDGRGRKRVFDGGELRLLLLKLIAEQPRHGYDLIREVEERSGGAYVPSPGVVYPTLTMLADMELTAEQPSDGARKSFAATPAGSAHLAEREEEVADLLARLGALAATRSREQGGPVRRAVGNLRQVIQDRMSGGTTDMAIQHDIAAIIDAAAQKIERL